MAATAHLTAVAPDNEKFTVVPRRKPNSEYRSREHLTEREVERLIEVAKDNRWGHRDATMVLIAFRHGLRASELVDLRWDQVDLEHALLHVRRLKNGTPATHPLTGKELRALRRLQREQEPKSPFVFTSERGSAMRRSLEQLAVKQEQMAQNIATVQALEQEIKKKMSSRPLAQPTSDQPRKPPKPPTNSSPTQSPPVPPPPPVAQSSSQ